MEYIKLHVLIVCLTISTRFSHQSSLENSCGRIAYVFPLTNTRPVHLTFTPVQSNNNIDSDAQWMVDRGGTFTTIINGTDGAEMFKENQTSHLKINYTEEVKEYGRFKVKHGNCESRPIKLEFTDLGECGMLQLRPDDVTSGQDAHLVYLSPLSAMENNISWVFSPSACGPDCEAIHCVPVCTAVNITGEYDVEWRPDVAEYVMTIPDIEHAQNGDYHVQCDNTSRTNNVTVKVIVLEPPSHPVISPLTTIDGRPYIIGRIKQSLAVVCNTTGGNDPVSVRFWVGMYKIPVSRNDDGYTPDNERKLIVSDHMAEVKCEVSNPALKKPLVATAKIYMIETPVNPRLIVNEAVQFQPINISCSVQHARPAPNIKFTIGSEVVMGGVRTTTIDDEGYYNSNAVLDRLERRWNGNDIECCFSHELYIPPVTCSKKMRIKYIFKPEILGLDLPVISQEVRPYYVINITCKVENANPKCEPIWTGESNLFLNMSPVIDVETTDGGVTSRTTATLNVSQENNADAVKCYTDCANFPSSTIVYEIRVPERPTVSIKLPSESNSSLFEVEYGENLVLECSVRSEPSSEISWKFNKNYTGVNVTKCGDQSLCLAIPFVGSVHNGPYTCLAENQFGAMQRTIVLLVTGEPSVFGDIELGPLSNLLQLLLGTGGLLLFVFLVSGVVYVVARKMLRKPESLASSKDRPKTRSCFQSPSGHKKHQYDVTFKYTDDAATDDNKQNYPHQHDSSDDQAQDSSNVSLLWESKESSLQAWNRTYGNTDDFKCGQTDMLVTPPVSDGEQENTLLTEEDVQKIAPIATEESKDDQHAEGDVTFGDMTSFRGQLGLADASKNKFQIQF